MKTTLLDRITGRSTTPSEPAPVSERDRLNARLAIARAKLAIFEQELIAGERTADEVENQRKRIVKLDQELAALDTSEVAAHRLEERRRTDLPKRLQAIRAELNALQPELTDLVERVHQLEAARQSLISEYGEATVNGHSFVQGISQEDYNTLARCGALAKFCGPHAPLTRWVDRSDKVA